MTDDRELGRALRQWRDRTTPATVGLPANGQRRAAGLRREELALLAGLSADYLTRLEQGRSTRPSVPVLTALARALRLSDEERGYLFQLAGQAAPDSVRISGHLTPSVQRLLDRLDDTPVGVFDAAWNLLAGNRLWAAVMGDMCTRGRSRDANVPWRHFSGQPGRVAQTPEQVPAFEVAMVADLRLSAARYPQDDGLARLIADLNGLSPRFAELWESGVVGPHTAARKAIDHPKVGWLDLDCDVLTVPGSDLRIIAYTAEPGSEAADKLALLRVIGVQAMSG